MEPPFFLCLTPKAIEAAEQDKPIAAEPEKDSVINIIEELYVHYEAIDKRLRELKAGLTRRATYSAFLTPTTIYVKKKKGFRIVSVEIKDNGAALWKYLYTTDENNAMDNGGRHQIFKGNLKKGDHKILATYRYSTAPDSKFRTERQPGNSRQATSPRPWTYSSSKRRRHKRRAAKTLHHRRYGICRAPLRQSRRNSFYRRYRCFFWRSCSIGARANRRRIRPRRSRVLLRAGNFLDASIMAKSILAFNSDPAIKERARVIKLLSDVNLSSWIIPSRRNPASHWRQSRNCPDFSGHSTKEAGMRKSNAS